MTAHFAVAVLAFQVLSLTGQAAKRDDFAGNIAPLFAQHCVQCHGPEKQKGGLRLDIRAAALRGGDSGEPAIVPGRSTESRLFRLVTAESDDERMPLKREALGPEQVALLQQWIDAGAEWPESEVPLENLQPAEMAVTEADRQHWSFLPLNESAPPSVQDPAWVQTEVDAFVRRAQEEKGILPSPPADRRVHVRRLYFDLIGLPPTPEEIEGWLTRSESSSEGVGDLVEHLLDSPHHGERWARHWLDVARYADSNGMEGDHDRPHAYHYRDFVIRAMNADMPYDRFVRWQLAGDEIAPDEPAAIAATGFLVAGPNEILNVPMEEEKLRGRANELDDMVSTTSQALLGLTLACARCHDHKYDPLPTRDYYRLMRVFNGGDRGEVPLAPQAAVRAHRTAMAAWQAEYDSAEEERVAWLRERNIAEKDSRAAIAALPTAQRERGTALEQRVRTLGRGKPAPLPQTFAFADFGPEPRETWFFERGDFLARREKMELGFLTVLLRDRTANDYWDAARASKRRDDSTQQRRALASWMTDLEHGAGTLLARVLVNRVWQHHFGDGLVRTVSDFGTRGELPSHPDLLEWLTGEFIGSGWSLKHLHRLIVNSATYQQGSTLRDSNQRIDPENRLLWRRRPLRIESEILRDAMLAVSGTLNPEPFGPSFKPPIPAEAMQARNVKNPYPKDAQDTAETRRRSIYMFHKRVVQYPLMQAFDAPDAQSSCGRRLNTTVAPQALALLHDPFVRLRAEELARRVEAEIGDKPEAQVRRLFLLCLSREPAPEELAAARAFLADQTAARRERNAPAPASTTLTDFCQALFGLNEFLYID